MPKPDLKKITNFIFELNVLKKIPRSGWHLTGIDNPESVAEHIWRAAQIGYILAVLEGNANPERVAAMLLIHDNGEVRTGDKNKVNARYLETDQAESRVFGDQLKNLGQTIEKKWQKYFDEFESRNTPEGIIAKDADWLENAFQAKEYLDLGNKFVENWIDNIEKALETESAKKILKEMKNTNFTDWWQGLKKMTYKKLYK
ncbi:MAG: HD domain-containing protein [Candidatus Kuenenbacteria bacterium]